MSQLKVNSPLWLFVISNHVAMLETDYKIITPIYQYTSIGFLIVELSISKSPFLVVDNILIEKKQFVVTLF